MISTKETLLFTEKVPRSIHSFVSIGEYMVGLSIEIWTFVSMFVRSLDGCFGVKWG